MWLLVAIRAFFMGTAQRKLGHLQEPLGPLQIVTPFGVHPRLSQLVCLLFDGLLFVRLRRMWESRVGEVLRSCEAVAKVYPFQVMFRDAMHEDVVSRHTQRFLTIHIFFQLTCFPEQTLDD